MSLHHVQSIVTRVETSGPAFAFLATDRNGKTGLAGILSGRLATNPMLVRILVLVFLLLKGQKAHESTRPRLFGQGGRRYLVLKDEQVDRTELCCQGNILQRSIFANLDVSHP